MEPKWTLILTKHSEPILEPGLTSNRWRLSERGRSRSVLLGERLAQHGPGVMVSSGEPKAVETAEISAGRLGIGCFVYPGLHEHDRTGVPFLGDEEFGRPEAFSRTLANSCGAARRRRRPGAGSRAPCEECSASGKRRWSR